MGDGLSLSRHMMTPSITSDTACQIPVNFAERLALWSRRAAPLWRPQGGVISTTSSPIGSQEEPAALLNRRMRALREALELSQSDGINARCELGDTTAHDLEQALRGEPDFAILELLEDLDLFQLTPYLKECSDAPTESFPFEAVLSPLARRIWERFFESVTQEALSSWSPLAREDLYANLLSLIVQVCGHALLHELHLYRTRADVKERAVLATLTGRKDTKLYSDFLRAISSDCGEGFYRRYPVLLRLLSIRIRNWRNNTRILMDALQRDSVELSSKLGISYEAQVQRAEFGLSDPHHGGRAVVILTMSPDVKVVFKPRSLGIDAAFMRIAGYLNTVAEKTLFKMVTILDKERYGWMEFVHPTKVHSEEALRTYYERAGALLALLHTLRATDCHNENLIAVDGYPLMIDLETIAHPDYGLLLPRAQFSGGQFDFLSSVARVGILPTLRSDPSEADISALGSALAPQLISRLQYEAVGDISLNLRACATTVDTSGNSPSELQLDRSELVNALQRGFEEGYHLILRNREELLEDPSLYPSLRSCEVRFVVRPSRTYGWLLQRAQDALTLRSGIDWSLEMERLYRVCLSSSISDQWARIADAERLALEGLDIPRFTVPIASRKLREGGATVLPKAFAKSPWQLLRAQLRGMCERDCATQLRFIELSFAQRPGVAEDAPEKAAGVPHPSRIPNRRARVLRKAQEIAEAIEHTMSNPEDTGAAWLTLAPTTTAGEYRVEAAGPGLYQGNAGIALFLSALYNLEPDRHYRSLAQRIFRTLPVPPAENSADSFAWDIATGASGASYALYCGGSLLRDDSLVRIAYKTALGVPDQIFRTTRDVDVISGLAGYVLVTELLSRGSRNPELLRKMTLAANRICELATEISPSCVAWDTLEQKQLAGFAHGSAGISYALLRAGSRLGFPGRRFIECATRGVRHEQLIFDSSRGNWRDLRGDGSGFTAPSWCHGAVGIGLVGLASKSILSPAQYSDVLVRSRDVIASELRGGLPVHSLCCGAPGLLEFLLALPDSCPQRSEMDGLIEYLLGRSAYRYFDRNSSRSLLPGMFVGAAGIGYQLLRTEFPDRVPPVLMFG